MVAPAIATINTHFTMRPNHSLLILFVLLLSACQQNMKKEDQTPPEALSPSIDWQGHRGARGLMPENTIPAFIKALAFPAIQTLELDVVVSRDQKIVVSHEPWMSATICQQPDGTAIDEDRAKQQHRILDMDYATIAQYDCGSLPHPRFPQQDKQALAKPLLRTVFTKVDQYCLASDHRQPAFNIEMKSHPDWYGTLVPEPDRFAAILDETLQGYEDRVTIQSFDPACLEAMHQLRPQLSYALLVENEDSVSDNLSRLSFTPDIYSCYHRLLDAEAISMLHDQNIRVIPWTVNETNRMRELLRMGVDGIITDYPDRIPSL